MSRSCPTTSSYKGWFLAWRGYCLTGETREQCFVLNVGFTAENGKSTLSSMFRKAVPKQADPEQLLRQERPRQQL